MLRLPPRSTPPTTLIPYTTLVRRMKFASAALGAAALAMAAAAPAQAATTFTQVNLIGGSSIFGATTNEAGAFTHTFDFTTYGPGAARDRKSTRLNSSN